MRLKIETNLQFVNTTYYIQHWNAPAFFIRHALISDSSREFVHFNGADSINASKFSNIQENPKSHLRSGSPSYNNYCSMKTFQVVLLWWMVKGATVSDWNFQFKKCNSFNDCLAPGWPLVWLKQTQHYRAISTMSSRYSVCLQSKVAGS